MADDIETTINRLYAAILSDDKPAAYRAADELCDWLMLGGLFTRDPSWREDVIDALNVYVDAYAAKKPASDT